MVMVVVPAVEILGPTTFRTTPIDRPELTQEFERSVHGREREFRIFILAKMRQDGRGIEVASLLA